MNRTRQLATQGFSLLEVLVAMAILATAFVAVGSMVNRQLSQAIDARRQMEAALQTRSLLAAVEAGQRPMTSQSGTTEDDRFQWDLKVNENQTRAETATFSLKKVVLTIKGKNSNYTYQVAALLPDVTSTQ